MCLGFWGNILVSLISSEMGVNALFVFCFCIFCFILFIENSLQEIIRFELFSE